MCLLDIIFYVANLKNAVLESRGIIRQGPNFDHIMLQKLSFVRRIRRTNTKKWFYFLKEGTLSYYLIDDKQ